MFNAVLIDSELRTDYKIIDLVELQDVLEEVLDALPIWQAAGKFDLSTFSITIRSIADSAIVASIVRFAERPEIIFVLKDDCTLAIQNAPAVRGRA